MFPSNILSDSRNKSREMEASEIGQDKSAKHLTAY